MPVRWSRSARRSTAVGARLSWLVTSSTATRVSIRWWRSPSATKRSFWAAPMSGRCNFPENHQLFAGFLPPMRERVVENLSGHDFIVAFGAPVFTYHAEGFGPYIPRDAELYQIIDDPQVASWTPVGTSIVASLGQCLEDLLSFPPPYQRAKPNGRPRPPRAEPSDPINVAFLMQAVAELRAPDSVIVDEAPSAIPLRQTYLSVTRSNGFYACASGGLGFGLAAAVGVAVANPHQHVIAVMGDGAAMYSIQTLWTAAQLRLPLTVVIVRNGRYEALHSFGRLFGLSETVGTHLPDIDFVALARGQGVEAVRVAHSAELHDTLRRCFASRGPILVEVVVA